ncbi:glycosyltransferase 87 family protein [Dactylosporangium sp. NPDC051484]|uniref:glycosyltransferase 87 family protein n=1 Tax=Dactylosporangium sp. NPDC051484 TaxID=3154942 RepID=UPI00344F8FB4
MQVPVRRYAAFLLFVATVVAAAIQVGSSLTRPLYDRLADLHVYWGSARMLAHGRSLYDFAAGNGDPFTYPPFAGIAFMPLAYLPEAPLRILWTAATILVVAFVAATTTKSDASRYLPTGILVPSAAFLLLVSAPVSSNIRFGQVSLPLAAMVMLDALEIVPPKIRGIATGIAAAIKLTPGIFILLLWVSGRRRAAAVALGTTIGCTALAWLTLPRESHRFWFTEVHNLNRIGDISVTANQSLQGVLLRLSVPDPWRAPIAVGLGLVVVAVALQRAARAYQAGNSFTAVVIVGAAGLIFSPVSWAHHQIWLVLAAFVAVSDRRSLNLVWSVSVIALVVLPITSVGRSLPTAVITENARFLLAVAVACLVPAVTARMASETTTNRIEVDHADASRDEHELVFAKVLTARPADPAWVTGSGGGPASRGCPGNAAPS